MYYDLNLKEGGVIVPQSQNPFVSDLAIWELNVHASL